MNNDFDFKAFNEGGMDELLRKTVEGHRIEPRPGLWKGISRKLLWKEISHFNFSNLSAKFWALGTAGIMVVATTVYLLLPSVQPVISPATSAENATVIGNTAKGTTLLSSTTPRQTAGTLPAGALHHPVAAPATGTVNASSNTATGSSATGISRNIPARGEHNGKGNKPSTETLAYASSFHAKAVNHPHEVETAGTSLSANPVPDVNNNRGTLREMISISPVTPIESPLLYMAPAGDTILTIRTASGIVRFTRPSKETVQFFSANLGVTPELSVYASPQAYSKINVWLDGGVTWHISRLSLATGLGLGYVYDRGKYRIDYKSNDSIGYYSSVVSYTIGSQNEIIYNTVIKNIYDSVLHQNDYRTLNRYTYLQVPLLLGYRLVESGTISLTVQAGPAFSFLLGTRKSDPVIEYSNATIIRVDDHTPSRIHTDWQVWGNLLLEVRMNRNFSLYLQPSFKYFLKPLVEQENMTFKSPWSVGLGVGLQFNFAPKKNTR